MSQGSLVFCLFLSCSKETELLRTAITLSIPDALIEKNIPFEKNNFEKIVVFIDSGFDQKKLHALSRNSVLLYGFGFSHPLLKKNFSTNFPVEQLCEEMRREFLTLKKKQSFDLEELLPGQSLVWKEVKEMVLKASKSSCNILIHGESGTGKELVARSIHVLSGTPQHPFVPVNCGAIPSELLESELFGHEKGSFTGAIEQRIGKFELCSYGTLFLDEIGDMPFSMQVKLLRVLQEREFEKIGSNKRVAFNARLVSATHQPLLSLIKEKKFREDLYYRLNVLPLYLPPLRERLEDLKIIFSFLCDSNSWKISISPSAFKALQSYSWPGNIREFYNFLARCEAFYPQKEIGLEQVNTLMCIDQRKSIVV